MNFSKRFLEKIGCQSSSEVFEYFMSTLQNSITGYDYFVNWKKVTENSSKYFSGLEILETLSGQSDIADCLDQMLAENHSLAKVFPPLLACRDSKFDILMGYDQGLFKSTKIDFKKLDMGNSDDRRLVVQFAEETGFLEMLKSGKLKSLNDYMAGVEAGLDSNARKNRTGSLMEKIVESHIKKISENNGFKYVAQANAGVIRKNFGIDIVVDKSNRIVDFAVLAREKLYIIETNFYGGGGSKLKSMAGEYRTMFKWWKDQGFGFIWITDGAGWHTTRKPIEETFNETDYLLNLDMISKGLLEEILVNRL